MAFSAPRCPFGCWRGLFLWQSGFFAAAESQESLRAYIENFSPYSHLCFFLIQFLSVILAPIPSNISALAGGVLFGTWVSFLLTFSAVTIGSLLVFSLARSLGRNAVTRLVGSKVSEKYLDVIHAKTDTFLVLAFLFPFSQMTFCVSSLDLPGFPSAASLALSCVPGPGDSSLQVPWAALPSRSQPGVWH